MAKEEFYLPSNDYMFKRIFAVDDGATKRFETLVCEILGINPLDIEETRILNGEIPAQDIINRSVHLDIIALLKLRNQDEIINVEMQRITSKSVYDRALYYWSLAHNTALLSGENFDNIKKTVAIWLLSQKLDDTDRYHRVSKVMDTDTFDVISDKLEIHFIELSKIDFSHAKNNETGKMYLKALSLNTKEEFNMLEKTTTTSEMQDLIFRVNAFNQDLKAVEHLRQRRDELLYEYEIKQRELKLQQAEQIAETAKKIGDFAILFVTEFYKTAIGLPEYIKKESGGSCTVYDFFKIMTKSTIQTYAEFSHKLAGYIDKLLELGVPITEISAKVNADPADVQAFYEKFKSSEK